MIYERDEITIIGIIPETELNKESMVIESEELKKIFYDALMIGPMFNTLYNILEEKKLLDVSGRIKCHHIVKELNTNRFLKECPNYVSSRETLVNIKLVSTALITLKQNYLTIDTIRHALNAYELECIHDKNDKNKYL
jgi:hypothetical protein